MNERTIELLAPRVKILSESLCEPIPPGDVNERERERKLERWAHSLQNQYPSLMHRISRKLEDVLQDLIPLVEQGETTEFGNNTGNAQKLDSLVEDIRDAVMHYQVCVLSSSFPQR